MLQIDRKIKKLLSHGMDPEEKSNQLIKRSPEKNCNSTSRLQEKYNRHIKNIRKRDFVSRVYRDLGFICEA